MQGLPPSCWLLSEFVPNMASNHTSDDDGNGDDGSDYQAQLIYAGVILGLTALLIYALTKALTYLIDSLQDELAYVKWVSVRAFAVVQISPNVPFMVPESHCATQSIACVGSKPTRRTLCEPRAVCEPTVEWLPVKRMIAKPFLVLPRLLPVEPVLATTLKLPIIHDRIFNLTPNRHRYQAMVLIGSSCSRCIQSKRKAKSGSTAKINTGATKTNTRTKSCFRNYLKLVSTHACFSHSSMTRLVGQGLW